MIVQQNRKSPSTVLTAHNSTGNRPFMCNKGFVPYSVKGLLEVYEDMVEILLILQVFLAEDPEIEYLFCGPPSGSETCLSSAMISSACGWSLFMMIFSMTLLGWLIRLMVL